MPLQSSDPRAKVSSVTHATGGYRSHRGAADEQSALLPQVSPIPASGWHVPLTQWFMLSHGTASLHAPPVVGAVVHCRLPFEAAAPQYWSAGHSCPGSPQKPPVLTITTGAQTELELEPEHVRPLWQS
jgi:hypothetical protein